MSAYTSRRASVGYIGLHTALLKKSVALLWRMHPDFFLSFSLFLPHLLSSPRVEVLNHGSRCNRGLDHPHCWRAASAEDGFFHSGKASLAPHNIPHAHLLPCCFLRILLMGKRGKQRARVRLRLPLVVAPYPQVHHDGLC